MPDSRRDRAAGGARRTDRPGGRLDPHRGAVPRQRPLSPEKTTVQGRRTARGEATRRLDPGTHLGMPPIVSVGLMVPWHTVSTYRRPGENRLKRATMPRTGICLDPKLGTRGADAHAPAGTQHGTRTTLGAVEPQNTYRHPWTLRVPQRGTRSVVGEYRAFGGDAAGLGGWIPGSTPPGRRSVFTDE
jgi:hypothetical protein